MTWIREVNDLYDCELNFPVISDEDLKISYLYDMIDQSEGAIANQRENKLTIRSVFLSDPQKIIRAIISYPFTVGRNSAEILRVLDALKLVTSHNVATPCDWTVTSPVSSG